MTSSEVSFWIAALAVGVDLIVRILAIIIVPRNRRPGSAMAWLLAIFFIPYIGVLFFLLIGSPRLSKKRRLKQARISEMIKDDTKVAEFLRAIPKTPEWFPSVVALNRELGAMPLVGENSARLQIDYEKNILDIAEDIALAEHFVHLEFYIFSYDSVTKPVFDAMEAAIARGVTVRVLLDHVAGLRTVSYRATRRKLTEIGVKWELMLPFAPLQRKYERPDLRNHRKLVVIDDKVAWMGSQNLIDSSYLKRSNLRRGLHWKDAQVRLTGPVVATVNAIFMTDWYAETDDLLESETPAPRVEPGSQKLVCQLVPSGPGYVTENNLRLFLTLLYNAREQIIITSPYFVPDESMLYAITSATQRGVRVELFVSEIGDQTLVFHAQRSYYEALLEAGVTIWLYKAPTILHSKHFSIDDDVAVIGSSNMDMRSFSLNKEISLLVRGRSFVDQMREVEDEYRVLSRRLTLEEWRKQSLLSTVLDNLARLTSALQ